MMPTPGQAIAIKRIRLRKLILLLYVDAQESLAVARLQRKFCAKFPEGPRMHGAKAGGSSLRYGWPDELAIQTASVSALNGRLGVPSIMSFR